MLEPVVVLTGQGRALDHPPAEAQVISQCSRQADHEVEVFALGGGGVRNGYLQRGRPVLDGSGANAIHYLKQRVTGRQSQREGLVAFGIVRIPTRWDGQLIRGVALRNNQNARQQLVSGEVGGVGGAMGHLPCHRHRLRGGLRQRYGEHQVVALWGAGVADGHLDSPGYVVVLNGAGGGGVAQPNPRGEVAGRRQGDGEGFVGFNIRVRVGVDGDGRLGLPGGDDQCSVGRLGTGEIGGVGGDVIQRPHQAHILSGGLVQPYRERHGVAF